VQQDRAAVAAKQGQQGRYDGDRDAVGVVAWLVVVVWLAATQQ